VTCNLKRQLVFFQHITDIDDFRENKEYITVLVYKNKGKRVYYPGKSYNYLFFFLQENVIIKVLNFDMTSFHQKCDLADPPPYIDGIRINSPHYLCKLLHTQAGVERYTLVISQYEKSNTINYSLRVYSSCSIELKKITNPYRFKDEVSAAHPKNYLTLYSLNIVFCVSDKKGWLERS
jgi:calpain-7